MSNLKPVLLTFVFYIPPLDKFSVCLVIFAESPRLIGLTDCNNSTISKA